MQETNNQNNCVGCTPANTTAPINAVREVLSDFVLPSDLAAVAEPVELRRVVVGLQEGRIVHYVLNNGTVRPLLVIDAGDRTGIVTGILFFAALHDKGILPVPLVAGPSGHQPECAVLVENVPFDDAQQLVPGTWYFPAKQPCVASGIDNAVLNTFQAELLEHVNEKLNTLMDHVNQMLTPASMDPVAIDAPNVACQVCDPVTVPQAATPAELDKTDA